MMALHHRLRIRKNDARTEEKIYRQTHLRPTTLNPWLLTSVRKESKWQATGQGGKGIIKQLVTHAFIKLKLLAVFPLLSNTCRGPRGEHYRRESAYSSTKAEPCRKATNHRRSLHTAPRTPHELLRDRSHRTHSHIPREPRLTLLCRC